MCCDHEPTQITELIVYTSVHDSAILDRLPDQSKLRFARLPTIDLSMYIILSSMLRILNMSARMVV